MSEIRVRIPQVQTQEWLSPFITASRRLAMLKDARDECPNDETIKGYAEDLYNDILVAAEKGASNARKADKK